MSSDYSADSPKTKTGVSELIAQCFNERSQVASAKKKVDDKVPGAEKITIKDKNGNDSGIIAYDKSLAMKPNPFITNDWFKKILNSGGPNNTLVRQFFRDEKANMTKRITFLTSQFEKNTKEIARLDKLINNTPNGDARDKMEDDFYLLQKENVEIESEKTKLEKLLVMVNDRPRDYFADASSFVENEKTKLRFSETRFKSNVYIKTQTAFYNAFACSGAKWKKNQWVRVNNNPPPPGGTNEDPSSDDVNSDKNNRTTFWTYNQGTVRDRKILGVVIRVKISGKIFGVDYIDYKRNRELGLWEQVDSSTDVQYVLAEEDSPDTCENVRTQDITNYFWGDGDWSKAAGNPLKEMGFAAYACSPDFTITPEQEKGDKCTEEYRPFQALEHMIGIW